MDTSIFKAYDVRGLYPQELNEDVARNIGRGFVAYLGAKTIGVSRDMRVSSPAPGRSILITSAPRSPSSWVQLGPARILVKSSTRMPASACAITHPTAAAGTRPTGTRA